MAVPLRWLGAGIGYRGPYRAALLAGEARPAVLEIMPDHFFARPGDIEAIAALAPVVFHDVGLSLGTVGFEDPDRLARIRDLATRARPLLLSDHLCLSRAPDGTDLGHLAPLWYTRELLAAVVERVQRLQDFFGLPIAVENITAPFVFDFADFTEPEFFHHLVDQTGCGVLLDLTNLWINGHNLGFDPVARLEAYPLEAVVQVHLAGGQTSRAWWVDSHAAPVEEPCFELLARLRGRAPLACIIVERDAHLPPLADLLAEAAVADAVWKGDAVGLFDRFKNAWVRENPALVAVEDAFADVIMATEALDPVEAEGFITHAEQLKADAIRVAREPNAAGKLSQLEGELRHLERQIQRKHK